MIPNSVFLFDIDGVIVDARGYSAAVQAAVWHFVQPVGLTKDHIPSRDVIALFESQRITSEWDMVPISLAILLNELAALNPETPLPHSAAEIAGYRPARIPDHVDFRTPILRIGGQFHPGEYPAGVALRLSTVQGRSGDGPGSSPLFPHLSGSPILESLLENTRDVHHSTTTRIFQHFSLGSRAFSQTYGLPADFETPSLLKERDRLKITRDMRDALLAQREERQLALAAYTSRPSLPPRELPGPHHGYAPEAEIALSMAGLEHIPRIGYGHIRWLAQENGVDSEDYLKPSPVQALAATLAALSEDEQGSLRAAARLFQRLPVSGLVERFPPGNLALHVFEDSPGGIEAVRRAAEMLNALGLPVVTYAWGVADHPEKVSALQRIGVEVFPETAAAIQRALTTLS